jgi:O-antigen ligase
MAKIVGEFGIIGFVFILFLFITSIAAGYILRKHIRNRLFTGNALYLFPLCAVYMIITELFIRGVGYFSPTFIFALFCLPGAIKLIYKKVFYYLKD